MTARFLDCPAFLAALITPEMRRRTRPMGVFADRTSIERILFAVFTHENANQGVSTPFLLTQNS